MSLTIARERLESLTILYRGPLASCNYDCHYCPFAKQRDSAAELAADRAALMRLVDWCHAAEAEIGELRVFFTPWGEALVRSWYRDAFGVLSHMPHVAKVAAQTNLSCPLDWLDGCQAEKIGLWCTYHPSQADRRRFLEQVAELSRRAVSHSVGMVGLKEDFQEIEQLRAELPETTYLWINAYKREPDYYSADDVSRLSVADPHFATNNVRHQSLGRDCATGRSVVSVDGEGTVRRCHFVDEPIGNLYDGSWREGLRPRACVNATCGCHIGYIHMPHLEQEAIYGSGLLERVPR